jgi:endonuclease/exonuclease/phosphatase family metal-dependent hydrolase
MEAHDSTQVPEIIESETLDLLTLNVAHGRGTALNQLLVSADGHRENLERIASMLTGSGVHVAALQEADGPSLWSGRFDHVEFLTQATAFRDTVRGYHADSWLFSYGAVLMSRFRMTQTRSHEFQPSWPTAGKGFVVGSVKWRQPGSGSTTRQVTLASVHLDFSRESVRRSQIAEVISELSDIEGPLIVMGDFNADWSDLDSPVRELARGLGLQVFRPADRELGTYNDRDRLDWILISPELTFAEYTVVPDIVSDHLAVIARIGWNNQESPVKHE